MNTKTAFEIYTLTTRQPLTLTQQRAIDLRKRGFNVFPMPYGSKEPFKGTPLKRLYNSPLHFCGDGVQPCRHGASVPTFASLFHGRKNIAVMCGETSGNLLAADCDTQSAYDTMGKKLDGLPYWAFTSFRGGSYLLRIQEGEAANAPKTKIADVQLWGNSHYVLVPLSVHPSGTVYRWRGDTEPAYYYATEYETLPAVSVSALAWLGVTLLEDQKKTQQKTLEMFGLPAKYVVLSERNRETLARGATEGERNTRLTALAYDLAGCGFDHADIEHDFLNAAAVCKPSYPKCDALAILKSAYSKERTPAKGVNTGENARIQQLYAFADSYDWKAVFGRKQRTRRAVFAACIQRSAIEGKTFRASVRELAEMVNRSFQYVRVCLADLTAAGLLRLATSWAESASGANVYAFGDTFERYCKKETLIPTCNNNVSFLQYEKLTNSDAWRDVFGLKGLGAVAGEVLLALQAKPYKSIYAIAKDTRAAYNSVKQAVKRLVEHGLAIHSQSEGLYYAEPVTESVLFSVSLKLKTNGRAELQRIRHTIDREIFVNRRMARAIQQEEASGRNGVNTRETWREAA